MEFKQLLKLRRLCFVSNRVLNNYLSVSRAPLFEFDACCRSYATGETDVEASSPEAASSAAEAAPPSNEIQAKSSGRYKKDEKSLTSLDIYNKKKKEYRAAMTLLRKQFTEEVKEKQRQKEAAMATKLREREEERSRVWEEKKATKSLRKIEIEAAETALRIQKEEERKKKAEYKRTRDKKIELRREQKGEAARLSSADWIEEEDLERKVVEAMAEPVFI